jgi:hypothetical protein
MKTVELQRWKLELLAQRQKELDAVEAKHKRKLDALSILLEDGNEPPPEDHKPTASMAIEYARSLNKLGATREAIGHFKNDRFTTAKLFGYVKGKYPQMVEKPSDLSNSVWVLKKAGDIETIKEGAGPDSPPEYVVTEKFRPASGNGV